MTVCGASGFVAHPPMKIANATNTWTGHFIYATDSAARRQHLPCSTRSSYGLTRLPAFSFPAFHRFSFSPADLWSVVRGPTFAFPISAFRYGPPAFSLSASPSVRCWKVSIVRGQVSGDG